jgi:hypothetical protein
MPTTLRTVTIETLKQYSDFIENQLRLSKESVLWFRGTGKSSYTLSPSIHRHATISDPENVIDLENKIMDRFNQRSVPFLDKPLDRKNDWEVLFFMQHYAIPTRLLDWSENPFIALYFALTSAPYNIVAKKREYIEDASIWVLDPVLWNREALKDYSYDKGILSVEEHFVDSYKPRTAFKNIREKPIAIFGTHNSSRIVSQRGVFTVSGKRIKPMEQTYIDDSFPQDSLIKLVLSKDHILSLETSLTSLGTTDSVVYPDLEGLAKEVRRFFKFDI